MHTAEPAEERAEISVVVPVYGCERCLRTLYERLVATLSTLTERFELVLVDDRSKQNDWLIIAGLAAQDARVRGVRLCRNFGQHHAIAAGLAVAEGRWVVVMDCDLQDPPEAIPSLYALARQGHAAVFARRQHRKDARAKRGASRAFAWLNGLLGGFEPDARIGNFSIVSDQVVAQLRRFRERSRNYAMEVHWLGFPTAYVDVEHAERHAGQSAYTWSRQLRHALATVLSQSTRPLYAVSALGLMLTLGAVGGAGYLTVRKVCCSEAITGWLGLMLVLCFLFGILFVQLGVVGVYLASVFMELKGRPTYVIAETTFEGARPTRALRDLTVDSRAAHRAR